MLTCWIRPFSPGCFRCWNSSDTEDSGASFRLITTASTHLDEFVEEGSYLAGLFKKLNEILLKVPPLRSRREDIPDITHLILTRIVTETGHARINGIYGGAMALLLQYSWPGNIGT